MPVRGERGVVIRRAAPLALVPAAAFAVHQLRYLLAFHGHASAELQAQGHSYLHSLVPWIVALVAIAGGLFLGSLGRALGGRCSLRRYTLSFTALWFSCAVCLVAIYVVQEFLEGLCATGHPGGLAGIFGYGGWWSILAALAVGLVLAALLHGGSWVLHEAAKRHPHASDIRSPEITVARAPRPVLVPRLAPLAGGWSGRGPPRLS